MTSSSGSHSQEFVDVGVRLGSNRPLASEADIQSDVKMFLLLGSFGLDEQGLNVQLEAATATGGRIDVLTGRTVIEVKRNLDNAGRIATAVSQLKGYVDSLASVTRQPCVGIVTDGRKWQLYQPQGSEFDLISEFNHSANIESAHSLAIWLEACMALSNPIAASPQELLERLGRDTPSYSLAISSIAKLWQDKSDLPSIALKRQLWSQMCGMIFGTNFAGEDELFFDHTYLVAMTKVIAHKLLGLDIMDITPEKLINGSRFADAGIHGVIDSDIFDWITEAGGGGVVEELARRIRHFDFSRVEHDLLKYLYEGVISAETRRQLGEYYTPDWLAEMVIDEAITDPLSQSVLDPSCGSGTFVFHAVRKFIRAAVAKDISPIDYLSMVQEHVFGMDLHPVAVQLAKVTWLLALGEENLTYPNRPALRAPISLGDSIQWRTGWVSVSGESFEILVERGRDILEADTTLSFPAILLDDLASMEQLLEAMERLVRSRSRDAPHPSIASTLRSLKIDNTHLKQIQGTLDVLCRLEDEGRNHIWGYFIRNQSRPAHFKRNHVDVIVGNPPWLSYRFMQPEMQAVFKNESQEEGLWTGGRVATHQDLSVFFFVKSVAFYLKAEGTVAMVLPFSVLSRQHYSGFRSGHLASTYLAFDESWEFKDVQPLFPVPAAVVIAHKGSKARPLPSANISFKGQLPSRELTLEKALQYLEIESSDVSQITDSEYASDYARAARQGASVVPRMLFCVTEQPVGPLGAAGGQVRVASYRSSDEKIPWKNLPGLEGLVERGQLAQLCLGETLLPFRIWKPRLMVLPVNSETGILLDVQGAFLLNLTGLADWLEKAESVWEHNRQRSTNLGLYDRLNYHGELTAQFPIAPIRMVYPASGSILCGAVLRDARVMVDTSLYWIGCGESEARYLSAIFNSSLFLSKVQQYQSVGLMGTRHFHKHPFRVPIPTFDYQNGLHQRLAEASRRGEQIAESVDLAGVTRFVAARQLVRARLESAGLSDELDALVLELLRTT